MEGQDDSDSASINRNSDTPPSTGMGKESEAQSAYALEPLSHVEEEMHGQHAVIEEIRAEV